MAGAWQSAEALSSPTAIRARVEIRSDGAGPGRHRPFPMLNTAKSLRGYGLDSRDGTIGKVAQHLLLAPTSLSVLGYENDASDRPALVMWNALPFQAFSQPREPGLSEAQSMRVRAIQRWENEGGEIPQ